MFERVRLFLASLALRPEIEGQSADRQHAGALDGWRSRIQRPDRHTPNHLRGVRTTRHDGSGQPQRLPKRAPLLLQDPTVGGQSDAFLGDRIAPSAWDGETRFGAPNVAEDR